MPGNWLPTRRVEREDKWSGRPPRQATGMNGGGLLLECPLCGEMYVIAADPGSKGGPIEPARPGGRYLQMTRGCGIRPSAEPPRPSCPGRALVAAYAEIMRFLPADHPPGTDHQGET